jgi:hypothetical protein
MRLMRNCRQAAAALLLSSGFLQPVLVPAADLPPAPAPFVAVYEVRTGGIGVGSMTRRFQIDDGNHYRFESVVESTGLVALLKPLRIEETSEGNWTAEGLRPARYAYARRAGKKIKQSSIEFDWPGSRAVATVNGTPVDFDLSAGTIDKLSYQLALMQDLAAARTGLAYRIADIGKTKDYVLAQRPREKVQVDGQGYSTIPVEYARDDGRSTVLWCAESLGYLPVRIEYTEKDGEVTTATLTRRE